MTTKTIQVPDGRGGWRTVEGEVIPGSKANMDKQAKARENLFYDEAGELAERMWQFARLHAQENNLTPEQIVFGVALLCTDMREHFPKGKEAFDAITAEAGDYFDKKKG